MPRTDLDEQLRNEDEVDCPEIRMILLGKPGAGKSSSGNTILGRPAFRTAASPSMVTVACQRERGQFLGQQLVVVDTPGSMDTRREDARLSVNLTVPGPDVFLLVLEPGRFTDGDKREAESRLRAFGEEAFHHTIVLFSHGDQLRARGVSIQTFISQSAALRGLVRQCGSRAHVLNNMSRNSAQMRDLLMKIRWMMQSNGGAFSVDSMPRTDAGVSSRALQLRPDDSDDDDDDRRQVATVRRPRQAGPIVVHINVNVVQPTRQHSMRPYIRSMPWSGLGAVLGSPFGPAGMVAGSALGNLVAGLEDGLAD
ncbi:unnamed protein product [Ophioblennius macclurei]